VARLQTPLGELTALSPDPLAGYKGVGLLLSEGKGGRTGGKGKGGGEWRGRDLLLKLGEGRRGKKRRGD